MTVNPSGGLLDCLFTNETKILSGASGLSDGSKAWNSCLSSRWWCRTLQHGSSPAGLNCQMYKCINVLIAKCISQNCKMCENTSPTFTINITLALHQAFDFVCLSGSVENRLVEWVDHLHQHFKCPPRVENGRCVEATDHLMMTICGLDDNECRYVTPLDAGYSTEFVEESLADHIYPTGRLVLRFVSHIICTHMEGSLSSSYHTSHIYLAGFLRIHIICSTRI